VPGRRAGVGAGGRLGGAARGGGAADAVCLPIGGKINTTN